MRVLIVGASGQLGRELCAMAPAAAAILAPGRDMLDLTSTACVDQVRNLAPEVIINTAAYTAVDAAESDAALVNAINDEGAGRVARAAASLGARLLHVSTDFVFDGSDTRPYRIDATRNPLGVYGTSKASGEAKVLAESANTALVLRTSWVYSRWRENFVLTMLRLMAERQELGVVCDQVGAPTWARNLARALWAYCDQGDVTGIRHWTDLGVASWYDFAIAIQDEAVALGLLQRRIPVRPLRSEEYPTPARRPAYSVLDMSVSLGELPQLTMHWRHALRNMLLELVTDTS